MPPAVPPNLTPSSKQNMDLYILISKFILSGDKLAECVTMCDR